MTRGTIFWVIMVVWLIFGILWPHWGALTVMAVAPGVLEWVLLALLGWQVFGPVIKPG